MQIKKVYYKFVEHILIVIIVYCHILQRESAIRRTNAKLNNFNDFWFTIVDRGYLNPQYLNMIIFKLPELSKMTPVKSA